MSKLEIKAFVYQIICFGILFYGIRYLLPLYSHLHGFWIPVTAFVMGTILAPKFGVQKTKNGEKMVVSWLFFRSKKG